MRLSLHLRGGQATVMAMLIVAVVGVAFASGGTVVLRTIQGANQLSFAQIMAIGGVLGLMPTTVTLWVIKLLYDVRAEVTGFHGELENLKSEINTKCTPEDVRQAILTLTPRQGDEHA